jgi:PPM family protein phosphatase
MFQDRIKEWLSRGGPGSASNPCYDLPTVLSTDIGMQRSENQDRVAAMKISAKASAGRPLIAIAVADGMGGMRDGAACATLTLSSFLYALIRHRAEQTEARILSAVVHANKSVFDYAKGKGGSTLSALIVDHEFRQFILNIGDSRIYSFGLGDIRRLTIDDSLAEAVGGHGRELLQFVGMGERLHPHIKPVSLDAQNLALTTDGIHFVPEKAIQGILSNAPELELASERLSALARWCGGPDNASSALVSLPALAKKVHANGDGIQLWDPFGALSAIWVHDDLPQPREAAERKPPVANGGLQPIPNEPKPAREKATRRKRKGRSQAQPPEEIQLKIEIESSKPEPSDDRR